MNEIERLAKRIADLERRMRGTTRYGTVEDVDPASGRMRMRLGSGSGDEPYLSGWIPYAQTAGAVKIHNPPSVGQQMVAVAPGGDLRQAIAIPMGFSDATASPSGAGDQHVLTFGSVTITLIADGLSIQAGGTTVTIDGGGLSTTGGSVRHNGTNIGDTHKHDGVQSGLSKTGLPE